MKVNLHNKYEIIIGEKKFEAYNTMLKTVFEKIKNLEPYNSYFAFGTGTDEPTFSDTTLSSYVASFANVTEEIQPDIKSGDMFVKKVKVFGENEANGLTFSEIGIASSSESNPTIFNHILLTDEHGDPVSITKPAGEEMVVRLTIYLEDDGEGNAKLVAGDNKLVKAILGEDCLTNHSFVITKGTNEQPNEPIYRDAPTSFTSYNYDSFIYNLNNDAGFRNELTIDFGEGELKEALVLLDNKPVIRFNCMGVRASVNTTVELEKNANNTLTLGPSVQSVLSVTDSVSAQMVDYSATKYAENLADKIALPFNYPFNNQTQRFVSKNGEYIAFVLNGNFYLYKNENLLIKQINTDNIDLSQITFSNCLIVDDYVFFITQSSPYVVGFVVVSGRCLPVSITADEQFQGEIDFNLSGIDIGITKNNLILISGLNSQGYGKTYVGSFNGKTNILVSSLVSTNHFNYECCVCLNKNSFTDTQMFFLTRSADGLEDTYYVESVIEDGTLSNANQHGIPFDLLNNSDYVKSCGRVIYSRRTTVNNYSLLATYYFPEQRRYSIPFVNEIDIWVSPDFNYCIKKFSDNSFKIYNLIGFSNPQEFSVGFSNFNQSEFVDFAFLKDTLLIFTSNNLNPIIAVNLGAFSTVIEGLADSTNENLVVNYLKYSPLGSLTNENVEGKLTLTVAGFEE